MGSCPDIDIDPYILGIAVNMAVSNKKKVNHVGLLTRTSSSFIICHSNLYYSDIHSHSFFITQVYYKPTK